MADRWPKVFARDVFHYFAWFFFSLVLFAHLCYTSNREHKYTNYMEILILLLLLSYGACLCLSRFPWRLRVELQGKTGMKTGLQMGFVTWNCHMMNTWLLFILPTRSHVLTLQSEGLLCKTTAVDDGCFLFFVFKLNILFGLMCVFFLHSDGFFYLIKPVTWYQVLHLNSSVVGICLCCRMVLDSVWVESAAVLFRPGWFSKPCCCFSLPAKRVNRVGLNFKNQLLLAAPAAPIRIFSSSVMLWKLVKSFVVSPKPQGNTRWEVKSDSISHSYLYMGCIRTPYF